MSVSLPLFLQKMYNDTEGVAARRYFMLILLSHLEQGAKLRFLKLR